MIDGRRSLAERETPDRRSKRITLAQGETLNIQPTRANLDVSDRESRRK